MDKQKFGNRMQEARIKNHLNIDQLAEKLSISVSFVRQMEYGKRLPRLELLVQIANLLNTDVNHLLCDSLDNCQDIVISDLNQQLQYLPPNRLEEVKIMIDAMLSYMVKKE